VKTYGVAGVAVTALLFFLFVIPVHAQSTGFYAYYTYADSDELPGERAHTGRYADVVVHFDGNRQIVFRRASSYLPHWKTEDGMWYFDEIVPRRGDGSGARPDKFNKYSYVRIIENGPGKAVVHWRYMPDFSNLEWDGVVDEYFTITPDGTVGRTVREGTKKIDEWNDPANVTIQILKLETDGITVESSSRPTARSLTGTTAAGSPVGTGVVGSPAAYWKFDEAVGDTAMESVTTRDCAVDGHKSLWKKGVSGTALEFDGYHSSVVYPSSQSPSVSAGVTVEAWIALGAYPFHWAPIVHQSVWDNSGYYLGIDQNGRPGFHASIDGRWQSVTDSAELDLFRWYHVAGTFDGRTGSMSLYIDGEQKKSGIVPKGSIDASNANLVIGLNSQKMPAQTGRIRKGKWPSLFGLDGLIDEVRIYDAALGPNDVSQSYDNFHPPSALRDNPDMDERHFPANPNNSPAEKFGAEYARLKYYETWDNMWRVSDHPDVVVGFDKLPVRMVFWRGISHGIGLVTENGKWGGDQSSENYRELDAQGEAEGCCEHMSDKQCRHSHVRIIENTGARAVVHWRYGLVDSRYVFVTEQSEWGDWADEYWTVYPDGVAVRHLARGKIWGDSWVETMFYSEPGTMPEDNVDLEAYTLVNVAGQSETYSWENGSPECDLANPVISMINTKSTYRPFNIYPTGSSVETFGGRTRPSHFHWWNHWPVSQITSDGRSARAADRAAHSSLVWGNPAGDYLMYGLTARPADSLIPLAKSWNSPPKLTDAVGCGSQGYKAEQRAYVLTTQGSKMSFTLNGSERSPIVNPCFVVKNWGSDAAAGLKIDGRTQNPDSGFRHGVIRDTDGSQTLIVWVEHESGSPVRFEMNRT